MHRAFGLTGGIACGKSTVARFFESLGAKIIDADRVGHELLQPSKLALSSRKLQRTLGGKFWGRVVEKRYQYDFPFVVSSAVKLLQRALPSFENSLQRRKVS